MTAGPLYFVLAFASALDLIVMDTFGHDTADLCAGLVRQCVGSAAEVSLHSVLLGDLLGSPGPLLCCRKAGTATSLCQPRSCALTSRAGFAADLWGGGWCVSFYCETSQGSWDLFSSSVLYIACLHTPVVLDIVFGYECLTVCLMHG